MNDAPKEPSLLAEVNWRIKAVRDDHIQEFDYANDIGSNAIAVAPSHMADGMGYLLSNSHQPNEGRFAWYEAHARSGQGWNIVGGLFPGGLCIFTGSNESLGWAHTTNYHNFGDIYALQRNPHNRHQYRNDGSFLSAINSRPCRSTAPQRCREPTGLMEWAGSRRKIES